MTLRGEVVRSYSEKVIADWFSRNGIRYVYEYRAFDRQGSVISRPDFYLPDYNAYVEYWGLADLPAGFASSRYKGIMRWKMEQYRRGGTKVISLYPRELGALDTLLPSRLHILTAAANLHNR